MKRELKVSGVGGYPICDEIRQVIASENTFAFKFERPPKRDIGAEDESINEVQVRSEIGWIGKECESESPRKNKSFISPIWPFKRK
jgi:hypothetical protein